MIKALGGLLLDGVTIGIALLISLLVISGVVLVVVAVADGKTRLISLRLLLVLLALRVGLAFCSWIIVSASTSAATSNTSTGNALESVGQPVVQTLCSQVSFSALLYSCVAALLVVAIMQALSAVVGFFINHKKQRKQQRQQHQGQQQQSLPEPLGSGDVKLIGVCCLYLLPTQLAAFFIVMMMGALALAFYFMVRHHDKTFPFAPAIVAGCLVAFVM